MSLDKQLSVLSFITDTFCYGGDGNAVSFTANLDREALGSVQNAETIIERWLPHTKGFTVFPSESRPQSPFEIITRAEYEAAARGETFGGAIESECVNGACPVR